jgi:hypothetical protein
MLGWAFGELLAVYTILYVLGGRKIGAANPDGLTCRTEIFALGLSRSYLAAEMRPALPARGRRGQKPPSIQDRLRLWRQNDQLRARRRRSRSCGVDRLDPAAVRYSADVGASGIQDQILATAMTEIPAFRVLNY